MNFKQISLFLVSLALITGCAGERNDTQVPDNTILAVRVLEGAGHLPVGERTQVALLSGDIDSPSQARFAAAHARWIPLSAFMEDSEFSSYNLRFVEPNFSYQTFVNNRNNVRSLQASGWSPYQRNRQNWVNQWVQPSHNLSCVRQGYVPGRNTCGVPHSAQHNYFWVARYNYRESITYRGFRQTRRNFTGFAQVVFYW